MNVQADKEDLFQEIILQAWKSYNTFRGESLFSTWLYRVALNTALTFFKKEKKRPRTIHTETFPEQIEYTSPAEEQIKVMYNAIGHLSKIDKALIMLYLEEYTYSEIAEILGITANNVAVKVNRIKDKLKEQTQKYYLQSS
jgi:RNA polymerase sigma-70 factor (ECF subfamily)